MREPSTFEARPTMTFGWMRGSALRGAAARAHDSAMFAAALRSLCLLNTHAIATKAILPVNCKPQMLI
jgi:hypothetical protein